VTGPSELWRLSATELLAGYRSAAFTPTQALQNCLAHIRSCSALQAWVMVDEAGARGAAQASTERWARGQPTGPLDGVPVALKDNLHAAGLPTGWGSALLDYVPTLDEQPVALLRQAGAVFVGKTALPEFAMQGHTINRVTGITRNPWNAGRTPGGSSGGAVAAVASGGVPVALATDGGGSIRRPAALTGLVGFKPSAQRIARGGGLPDLFAGFEDVGPIARTVADVELMTRVLAPDLAIAQAAPTARILHIRRFGDAPVDTPIADAVQGAAEVWRALGHAVASVERLDFAVPVNAVWPRLSAAGLAWMLARAADFPEFALAAGAAPDLCACTEAAQTTARDGGALTATALYEVFERVQALRQDLRVLFREHDFLLTPCTAALAWPADEPFPTRIDGQAVGPRGHAVFTGFANAAGLPAISLPCGMSDGLPLGFQLVGAPGSDAALLAMARQFEAASPWRHGWPPAAIGTASASAAR
jgi:aspartyl-tRNA(Asn)/glutamyl-tRNA(Gln) amidotransferase subunit A